MRNVFTADFETTQNPENCRVWLWGLYDIEKDSFVYGTSIEEFFDTLFKLPNKSKIYFHNLKFDGEFNFYEIFRRKFIHSKEKQLENGQFSTLITDMGVFYAINVKYNDRLYIINDSLKIINLPVRSISKAFKIEQKKGDTPIHFDLPVDYVPTKEEIEYQQNDCEIVGKALTYFFNQKLTKMTQAGNAMFDFKNITGLDKYEKLFPVCYDDSELRQSYKGGFAYVNPVFQRKTINKPGIVLDVNSLYPSVMYNCFLPYGEGIYYEGKYKPDKIYNIYIQMFRCNFELKPGFLPTIQLKHTRGFIDTEYATSSNDKDITLCLTSVDLEMFFKHYNVYNIEYFGGWKYKSSNQIFKTYIDKWIAIKNQATIDGNEGLRSVAKTMLNALYGRFALNPNARQKIPVYDGELVHYQLGEPEQREPVYVPVSSFITAYARRITISSAQANIERFIYADTDSLHMVGLDLPTNIEIDNVKLGAWKFEGKFIRGKYLRAKSYIEDMYITPEEWEKLKPEKQLGWKYNKKKNIYIELKVACAGLPHSCHDKINFNNFKNNLTIPGKLQHKRVKGGVILKNVDFTLKLC